MSRSFFKSKIWKTKIFHIERNRFFITKQNFFAFFKGFDSLKLIAVFLMIFSCAISKNSLKTIPRSEISSEIFCQDGRSYLIRYIYAEELRNAIRSDYERKMNDKSSENYTTIKIPRIESFHIEKNPPENLINCEIKEGYLESNYPRYIRHFNK